MSNTSAGLVTLRLSFLPKFHTSEGVRSVRYIIVDHQRMVMRYFVLLCRIKYNAGYS